MATTTGVTTAAHLSAVPDNAPEFEAAREFGVIEGRAGLAARVVRFLGTTLLVTLVVGLIGALVLHATIIEDQRELDAQRVAITRIAGETEAMRSELAELEAPARVVAEARELGMVEAPSIDYITAPSRVLDERTLTIAVNQLLVNE